MKVLQLGKFYPVKGGVEKVMYDLTKGLGKRGIHCDMLCVSLTGKYFEESVTSFSRIIAVKHFGKVASTYLSFHLIFWMRKNVNKYDIVHIHHPDPMASIALRLSNFKGSIILHWHSDIIKQKVLLKFYKPFQDYLLNKSKYIVGTTMIYLEQSMHVNNFLDKAIAIPIGIDINEYIVNWDKVTELKKIYSGKKIVFSLGRFIYYKGFEYLIGAAPYLDEDVVIIIGGDGSLFEECYRIKETLPNKEKIILTGYIETEEIASYFAACDIYAVSSVEKSEAFGITLIEAMMFGKPIISTDIKGSGITWVNENGITGLIVEPKNSSALAAAIKSIFQNKKLYDSMSLHARERFFNFFDIDKMITKTIEIYNN